jgi:hypothetical protein
MTAARRRARTRLQNRMVFALNLASLALAAFAVLVAMAWTVRISTS